MAVTAGALSQVSVTDTTASLSSAAASGGTGPYTYQWYKSTVSGFTPGAGNIIDGATSLTLDDTGLIPGTIYYYKVVATDTGASSATDTSAELAVTTAAPALSQNQFQQSSYLGVVDLPYSTNTIPCQVDSSETGTLYPGQAVKMYDRAGGVPKVVACSANSDDVFGFINFNIKSTSFSAQDPLEVSSDANVMFLYATEAISRGVKVSLDLSTRGGVRPATSGDTGDEIVGYAIDKASAAGELIRVKIKAPYFGKVS